MLGILHLSDMHLKESKNANPILNRIDSIVAAVKNESVECNDIIIIFSGDIAFSGKSEEYDLAYIFFEELIRKLRVETKAWFRVIFVAGNHDCYFEPNSIREIILKQSGQDSFVFDQKVIDVLCETQKEYFSFTNEKMSFWRRKTKSKFKSKLYEQIDMSIGGRLIKFHCFNSASFSQLKESPGKLNFPIELFEEQLKTGVEELSISIIHHPLNWLNTEAHRALRNKLIEISDIVLTGHEHIPDEILIERKGDSTKFIESGALQDNYHDEVSQFGLIIIDMNSKPAKAHRFLYSFNSEKYIKETKSKIDFKAIKTKRNLLEVQESFKVWLEEMGAPIAHPRKEDLYLEDLYIYPDVQVLVNPNEDTTDIINKEISIEELFQHDYCIIIGQECSGKTSFLKKSFEYNLNKGNIPLLLEGADIKKYDNNGVNSSLLKKAFRKQYYHPSQDFYDQIDRKKIIILIDNFGNCPLDIEKRILLINNLKKWFGAVYITARELIHFDPINTGSSFDDFNICRIVELNHILRKKIIQKWNALGHSLNPNIADELSAKNLHSVRFINSVLQKHFTEPFPIYILTLLQVQDANSSTLDHGSIGFYYEYLIKHSLQESAGNKNLVPLYETFLKELCYFLFEERLNNINEKDFQIFLDSFTSKKRVTLSYSNLTEDLLKSQIIRIVKNQVTLHQPYIYYYYASRAIDDRLKENKTQKRVERMIERLYVQEFEGIILFLSHLSNNPFVLETLKNKCSSYFSDYEPASIDKDIVKIDKVITNEYLPLLEASDEPLSNEQRKSSRLDNKSYLNDLENDPDKDVDFINSLNQFVRAVKTFELMGNVVKINYSWDYDKKLPLVKETYGLTLRLMSAYFKMIENGAEEVVAHIKQISTEKEINGITELKMMTKNFTMHLTFAASYNLIRRISYALGHQQLRPLFQEISKDDFTNANKLIEFSIDLLQLGIYNESEILKYLSESRGFNRPMARLILRNFVYEYTQLFKIDVRTRNHINAAAKIQMKDQRRIQNTSKRLK